MGRRTRHGVAVVLCVGLLGLLPWAADEVAVDEATTLAPAAAAAPVAPASSPRFSLYTGTLPDGSGTHLRWDPCSPVTYQVSLRGVPTRHRATALAETKAAVGEVAAHTGLSLVYRGISSEVPLTDPVDPLRQSADLLIAWVRPDQTTVDLAGGRAGQAGARGAVAARAPEGRVWGADDGLGHLIVRSYVVLDAPQLLADGKAASGPGTSRRNVLLHELGHAVGLGHAEDPGQLMYPRLTAATPDGFADGDLEGLSWLGADHECLRTPAGVPDLH